MTNAEAIEMLSRPRSMKNVPDDIMEAHEMAIKALEQQTCEDAVSRQAVLGLFAQNADAVRPYSKTWEEVKALLPVNPQPKTGHWIYTGDYLTEGMLKCSECGEEIDVSESYYDFCPVCGAKMVEPQESEE